MAIYGIMKLRFSLDMTYDCILGCMLLKVWLDSAECGCGFLRKAMDPHIYSGSVSFVPSSWY